MNKLITAFAVSSVALTMGCGPGDGDPPAAICPPAVSDLLELGAVQMNTLYDGGGPGDFVSGTDMCISFYSEAEADLKMHYYSLEVDAGLENNLLYEYGVAYTEASANQWCIMLGPGVYCGAAGITSRDVTSGPGAEEDYITFDILPSNYDLTPPEVEACIEVANANIDWCDPVEVPMPF